MHDISTLSFVNLQTPGTLRIKTSKCYLRLQNEVNIQILHITNEISAILYSKDPMNVSVNVTFKISKNLLTYEQDCTHFKF